MVATLNSNRGSERLELAFLSRRDCGPDPGVVCDVTLVASSWADGTPSPIRINLGKIHLSLTQVRVLMNTVGVWLDLPLEQLGQAPLVAEVDLMFTPPDHLVLRFAPRDDTVAEVAKPVLTISYSVGGADGSMHFITDQSGLRLFLSELGVEVSGAHSAA
jgi:hypothetical protein